METKNFLIILLSVVLAFAVFSFLGSIITGYIIYGNLNSVFPNNTLSITAVFSIVILISIIVLRKKE